MDRHLFESNMQSTSRAKACIPCLAIRRPAPKLFDKGEDASNSGEIVWNELPIDSGFGPQDGIDEVRRLREHTIPVGDKGNFELFEENGWAG